ncbi:MAG: DUF4249 family protein [Bacteroidetes bacterium]|nr:DUF4249 family protein [Bacteroidota bacterium]
MSIFLNIHNPIKGLFLLAVAIFIGSGCDPYTQDVYTEQVVVESYLTANNPLTQVRLSTTGDATEVYSFERFALRGAQVMIWVLKPNSGEKDYRITYEESTPGVYQPTEMHVVQPGYTYQLEVFHPEYPEVEAFTTIPASFQIINPIPDTLYYQSTEQLTLELASAVAKQGQNYYIINTVAEQALEELLTPFYLEFVADEEEEEKRQSLSELQINSSGILSEGNFNRNEQGNLEIRYPWLAVAYFGVNDIIPSLIDQNLYDYIRSESVQLGGSTLSPGEIQNVITPIVGGVGIFGSMSRDTARTFILPLEFEVP